MTCQSLFGDALVAGSKSCYCPGPMPDTCPQIAAPLLVLLVALASCAEPEAPEPLEQRHQGVLIEDLPELGGDYPAVLIDGLSRQLIDELNCIEPGVLVTFESRAEPGYLYTENNIPHLLRPEAVEAALATARDEGDYLTITSGYRDAGMQYYDYLRGQRFGFLAARPGGSRHQGGQAIDVDQNRHWRQPLQDHGWLWPLGTRDAPHFEWHDLEGDLRPESLRVFQRLWNRNTPDDLIAEDGVWGPMTEARMAVTPAEGFEFGGCDLDMDGHADTLIGGDDCDDERSDVHAGAEEICGDGLDQDCSGADLPCEQPDAGSDVGSDLSETDAVDPSDIDDDDVDGNEEPDASAPDTPGDAMGQDGDAEDGPDSGSRLPPSIGSQKFEEDCGCTTPGRAAPFRLLRRR
jgi:hypothetical protein